MKPETAEKLLDELAAASYSFVQAVKELDKGRSAWYNVFLCRKDVERILGDIERERKDTVK